MTQFDDRSKGEQILNAKREELEFKAQARRNKTIGVWAAGLMGLEGDAADKYAATLVFEDLKEHGDDDVVAKLLADFENAKVEVSEHVIRREMDEELKKARTELGA